MRAYLSFVLRHRLWVLAALALVTGLAGYSASRGVVASSVIRLFFGDNPAYTAYRGLADRFAGSDLMVIAFDDPALLTPEGLDRLGRVTDALEALPDVRRVDSVARAPRIRAEGDDLFIETYADLEAPADRAAVVEDELVAGWLVSEDGRAAAVLVELTADPDRPIEVIPQILDQILGAFVAEGLAKERLHLAGIVPESAEATAQARFTLERLFPVTVLVLALVVFALFLRIWPVIITGGVSLVAIVWTFGLAIALDPQVNLLMAMVPGMITVIAFSDIVHLYAGFAQKVAQGLTQAEAVLESGVEVGEACLYTSLTTFVGFASLVFIPTPVLRQLGVVLGAGVGIALLLALTLVPIALSLLPGIRAGQRGESLVSARALDRITDGCLRLATRRPKAVVAAFAVFTGLCLLGISQLTVEASFSQRLDPDNPVRRSQAFIQERFAGANFLDVYILGDEDGRVLDPDVFGGVARFQAALLEEPAVDGVRSVVDLMDVLHRRMTGAEAPPGGFALPETRPALAQYLLLFEISGGEGLSRMIDEERRALRLSVRLDEDGLRGLAAVGDRAAALGRQHLPDDVTVTPTGIAYLLGDWVSFILEGQRRGLLFAVSATAIMMMLCLRSWRVGLWSMIPNLLPLLALGGYVGGVWDQTDSDTMLVATFAIGIAVDDTIHFLTRFRFEVARTPDRQEAMRRTVTFTGRAIVQTTVILCLGFLPFGLSEYFSTRIIGTLLPMTLVVALVADLLLVPALVTLGWMVFETETPCRP